MKALFANGPVPGVQPEKKIVWNTERIKWWLANGAQPSETVVKLLEKVSRRPCRIYPLHHPLSTRSSPAFIAPPLLPFSWPRSFIRLPSRRGYREEY